MEDGRNRGGVHVEDGLNRGGVHVEDGLNGGGAPMNRDMCLCQIINIELYYK